MKGEVNSKEIQRFFGIYRDLLKERHKYIPISNFEGSVRKPIDKIYVCPNFIKRSKENKNNRQLEFFDFLSKIHRAVILGDPGNGKTTFTKKICYELSSRYSDRLFAGREIVPFVIVVKDYQAEKKKNNISIKDFINEGLNTDYQIESPKGAFEYLLLNGYILLIFDGLDELLDTTYREKMVNEIESFCTLYPSIPIIVTSRRIGYEEAALREDMFEIYEMTSFNGAQIQEYVEKWFSLDYELRPNERSEKAKRFMIESEKVSDLRSNSLMLSLMCNIYKQENYIPENRPKIYQKCAEMLFKKWDRRREINPEITIQDSKIESLLSHLAHWIYTNESSKGVREEELIRKATEYLYGSTYEDSDEAKKVAKEFVTFSKGRAWIFTAISANNGQELYQFTHRTFLEYFTAEWFCKNYEETIELTNELIPKISKREWDVVTQLAFQIRGEYSENATDKIFCTLMKVAKGSKEVERGNLLSFAARSLEFMTPSPNVVKEITKDCFEFSLSFGKNVADMKLQKERLPTIHYWEPPVRLILDLRYSVRKNRTKVVETLKDLIIDHIKNKRECEATLAAEVIFELARGSYDGRFAAKERLYWSEISNAMFKECYQHNKLLFEEDLHLCLQSYNSSSPIKIETVLKLHGLEGILSEFSNFMRPESLRYGIGYSLLDKIFPFEFYLRKTTVDSYTKEVIEKTSGPLQKIGEFCLEYPLVIKLKENLCTGIEHYKKFLADMKLKTRFTKDVTNVENRISILHDYSDPTAIFGVFCLLAILFELNNSPRESRTFIKHFINEVDTSPLKKVFLVWLGYVDYIEIENELDIIGFTSRQKEFIGNWAQKNIRFLRSKNKSLKDYEIDNCTIKTKN